MRRCQKYLCFIAVLLLHVGSGFAQNPAVTPSIDSIQNQAPQVDAAENIFALGDVNYSNPFALDPSGESASSSTPQLEIVEEKVPASRLEKLEPVNSTGGWFFFILLVILAYLALIVSVYREEVGKRVRAFINLNFAGQQYRDRESLFSPSSVLLYLLFFVSAGTLIYKVAGMQNAIITGRPWLDLPVCIVGVALMYLLKHLQLSLISSVYPFHSENSFYSFVIANTNQIIGIILVPMLFFISFSPEELQTKALWATISMIGVAVIYRWIKGLAISANFILKYKFHFFMYICAVEIAPMVILIKLIIKN
jgi:Domain of unknown function (DUF4271)